MSLALLGYAHARLGERGEALHALEQFTAASKATRPPSHFRGSTPGSKTKPTPSSGWKKRAKNVSRVSPTLDRKPSGAASLRPTLHRLALSHRISAIASISAQILLTHFRQRSPQISAGPVQSQTQTRQIRQPQDLRPCSASEAKKVRSARKISSLIESNPVASCGPTGSCASTRSAQPNKTPIRKMQLVNFSVFVFMRKRSHGKTVDLPCRPFPMESCAAISVFENQSSKR